MRTRQAGYWHFFGVALVLGAVDLVFAVIRLFAPRAIADDAGAIAPETSRARARRIARTLGPHIAGWGLVVAGFWAIIHFGPLKPVHEWFP
jgi:hypothetical protein